MELTSLDVHYLSMELAQFMGAKVEKIFQSDTDRKDLLVVLYLKDHPKLHLRLALPGMVCLQDNKPLYPQVPPALAMFLRKYLVGARVVQVKQCGFDRVITFTFDGKMGRADLVVEILPPGNVLLIVDGKVKNLAEHQRFKDRQLRGGIDYVYPPPSFNVVDADTPTLIDLITTSTRESIVKTLAITVGLGGVYAEEICVRTGIDKNRADLKKDEVSLIAEAVNSICNERIKPHKSEKRIFPFEMRSVACEPDGRSFLLALSDFVTPPKDGREIVQGDGRKKKAETMLKAQEKQLGKLNAEIPVNSRKGEVIFEQYQLMSDIINTAKLARKEKQDPEEALKRFPEVKKYHKKSGEIEVELDD